jgi:chorismate mutase/GNAT superfamily N-acetyltransferase
MPTDELTLRRGTEEDLPRIANLYLASRAAAYPLIPADIHSESETRAWTTSWDLQIIEVWLAESAGRVLGFAAIEGDWLNALYVDPQALRQGIGGALLALVKQACPEGFCLWVFASNEPARRFYEAHDLVALEATDGHDNEEHAPDVRMAWPGPDPLTFYRFLIDGIDEQLADLLARRAALTRVVHEHKAAAGGPVVRDPQREGEIVDAISARAPELGRERVARIVHAIITESVDAAQS